MAVSRLVIGFCYAFLAGIAGARFFGMGSAARSWLAFASLAALAVSAGLLTWVARGMRGRPVRRPHAWAWMAVLVPGLLLGALRQAVEDRATDRLRGVIAVEGGSAGLVRPDRERDLARLALRKDTPLAKDLRVRLNGRADVRVAARDAEGRATLDAQGRWRFHRVEQAQQSGMVHIRASDPVGTVYRIDEPFSRVDRVEIRGAGTEGSLSLLETANHLSAFVGEGRAPTPVRILGRVTADPAVYGHRTRLTVSPAFLQAAEGGPWFRVAGGDLEVEIRPDVPDYARYAGRWAYGADVEVHGEIPAPRPRMFPGGFDAAAFMRNHGVFGRLFVRRTEEGYALHRIALPDGTVRKGAPLVIFSLALRDRLLGVIKQTVPYPSSAFLGGVTLGLRHGLQDVRFDPGHLLRTVDSVEDPEGGDSVEAAAGEDLIFEQFRASGVNHVLAVSGLHVTILTALFAGLFSLVRVPRRLYVPLVIAVLVIFAIITGARPSTVRAVIMNSLFLLSWAYLDQGLRGSALLGVPLAALMILLHNPWMLTDPSFTLSFGAILSLALLTPPVLERMERLRGSGLMAAGTLLALVTATGILCWPLLSTWRFFLFSAAFAAAVYWFARRREAAGRTWFRGRGVADLPSVISAFLAAQVGIQVGMMMPLSAYYFNRWAFGGAYANLLAIPLIGVVLQLGITAGLLGFIPGAGLPLALVLNGANGIFSALFLLLARGVSWLFPFPFVSRPLGRDLWVWYALVACGIGWRPLGRSLRNLTERSLGGRRWAPGVLTAVLIGLLTLPLWAGRPRPEPGMQVTVLPLGFASSVLVETPTGRRILVDAGFVDSGERRRNDALRTVLPFLSHRRIRRLDDVILLGGAPERAGGLPYLLRHADVRRLVLPDGLDPRDVGIGDVIDTVNGSVLHRLAGRHIRVVSASVGEVLHEETWRGLLLRIEVVCAAASERERGPGLALRISLGESAVLLAGDLSPEALLGCAVDPADVLVVPARGASIPASARGAVFKAEVERMHADATASLLDRVQPRWAVMEFGNPRPVLGGAARDAQRAFALGRRYYRERLGAERVIETDTDHAVFIHASAEGLRVDTQARRRSGDEPMRHPRP